MKEEMLKELVERTFRNIACPLEGHGVYAELQNAITAAYNLGKVREERMPVAMPARSGERMAEGNF